MIIGYFNMRTIIKKYLLLFIYWTKFILLLIIFGLLFRILFFEVYKITSPSMEPTLLSGDIILVSKMTYGPRLLRIFKYFKNKDIEYFRIAQNNMVQKGDVVVFNWPDYGSFLSSSASIFGTPLIKRCIGLSGDSILIRKEGPYIIESNEILFPFDTALKWSLDHYGPLFIPGKGKKIELSQTNILRYHDILRYENPISLFPGDRMVLNDNELIKYAFKQNYYFMIGDNFYYSQDSRYWGFLPEGNIIGKAIIIVFSVNSKESGFKKVRYNRIMKQIKRITYE